MAVTVIEIEVKWENNKYFELTSKENSGPILTIARMDENGHIATLWPAMTDLVERYIKALMARIGQEMAE